jgi:tetratricopeptide (TPR) repeat protein
VKSYLDRVIELQTSFAEAYFNRANVSAKLNDFKSAIVDYTTAISLNDCFAEAYYNRGLAKIYTGNTQDGVSDLSKAGELGMFQAYSVIKRFR